MKEYIRELLRGMIQVHTELSHSEAATIVVAFLRIGETLYEQQRKITDIDIIQSGDFQLYDAVKQAGDDLLDDMLAELAKEIQEDAEDV